MSALFCTREFSSATPEDRAARRPRGGMYESRRLPQGPGNMQIQAAPPRAGEYANLGGSPKGYANPGSSQQGIRKEYRDIKE